MTDWVNRFGCFGVCCLANGAFEGEQHKWAIRVSAMKRWIIIGICQIEKAEENQFEERGFKESMHGHYCVVSNGFVFSHSDAEVNSTVKSFKFRKGNVLQFEYKPELAKLIVTKDNNERIETVFKIEVGKKYAPFVYFIDSEDSVKLIE